MIKGVPFKTGVTALALCLCVLLLPPAPLHSTHSTFFKEFDAQVEVFGPITKTIVRTRIDWGRINSRDCAGNIKIDASEGPLSDFRCTIEPVGCTGGQLPPDACWDGLTNLAEFTMNGAPNALYDIGLPDPSSKEATFDIPCGAACRIDITEFNSFSTGNNAAGPVGKFNGSGQDTVKIGATVFFPATGANGSYFFFVSVAELTITYP